MALHVDAAAHYKEKKSMMNKVWRKKQWRGHEVMLERKEIQK